jgi:hypothetical protein
MPPAMQDGTNCWRRRSPVMEDRDDPVAATEHLDGDRMSMRTVACWASYLLSGYWAGSNTTRFKFFSHLFTFFWAIGPNLNRLIVTVAEFIPLFLLAVVKGTVKKAYLLLWIYFVYRCVLVYIHGPSDF